MRSSNYSAAGIFLLVFCLNGRAKALVMPQKQQRRQIPLKELSVGLAISTATLLGDAAPAVAGDAVVGTPLESAIIQVSDTAYPVFSSISSVSPLSTKLAGLVEKKIPAQKTTDALDKGIDSFLAIPDEKVSKFASTLKSSYEGVSGDSCSSVPALVDINQVSSLPAVQALDPSKVKALQEKYSAANKAVPTTPSGAICLPATQEGLEQLWIAQTELTLNIPRPESKAFVKSFSSAVQSVPNADLLRLVPDAKKAFTSDVDMKTSLKFEKAGKALEKAFQQEPRIQQRLSS